MSNINDIFNKFGTYAYIFDGSTPQFDGDIIEKQNIYFGCNYQDVPTVIIEWSEKGRGFGEYVFQIIDGKMVCHSEGDSKETVKRVLSNMVDQCEFID